MTDRPTPASDEVHGTSDSVDVSKGEVKMTASDETERIYPKSTSHDGKKVLSEKEAAEVVLNKPWFKYYKCQYCHTFHLTKQMNPHLWHKKHQEEIIAAAVQAESRKLLERLKEKRDTCYDCVHEDEDLNNQPFVPVTAIDAELARLDSEEQKLGGK